MWTWKAEHKGCHGTKEHDAPVAASWSYNKRLEKRESSENFTSTIIEALQKNLNRDVATIEVDLTFNTEAKSCQETDEYLRIPARQEGEENNPGWRAASITFYKKR